MSKRARQDDQQRKQLEQKLRDKRYLKLNEWQVNNTVESIPSPFIINIDFPASKENIEELSSVIRTTSEDGVTEESNDVLNREENE